MLLVESASLSFPIFPLRWRPEQQEKSSIERGLPNLQNGRKVPGCRHGTGEVIFKDEIGPATFLRLTVCADHTRATGHSASKGGTNP
jgi:hypothetical protein